MNEKPGYTKQLLIRVSPTLYEAFETKCREEGRNVSEVVRELMSKYNQGWVQTPNTKEQLCGNL